MSRADRSLWNGLLICCLTLTGAAEGQVRAPGELAAQSAVGTVTKIDVDMHTISVRTDQNEAVSVGVQPTTRYQRIAPGVTDLTKAANIAFGEIGVGDRVLARGLKAGQELAATLVVVMSQADVATKQNAERADWDKRGISGLVTAIAPDSVTVNARGPAGTKAITVGITQDTIVRRYAPDSINFADAKPAKLEDIKVGDQLRARGDKNSDGTKLTAVEIVAGTFKTIAAQVLSIDLPNNEIRIRDLDAKTSLVVKIIADSKVQKLSPAVAQSIAARLKPEAAGKGGASNGGDIQQMLETSPPMNLSDLKNGDAVVVSSTVGATAGKITAIRFIAGVEPILTKPGTKEMSIGGWTLDLGGGQ